MIDRPIYRGITLPFSKHILWARDSLACVLALPTLALAHFDVWRTHDEKLRRRRNSIGDRLGDDFAASSTTLLPVRLSPVTKEA